MPVLGSFPASAPNAPHHFISLNLLEYSGFCTQVGSEERKALKGANVKAEISVLLGLGGTKLENCAVPIGQRRQENRIETAWMLSFPGKSQR